MAEKKKRRRNVRQEWRPNMVASVLYKVWQIAFTVFKIALGAVATVGLICVVCGFVFVTILGDYLVEDIVPKAEFNLDDYKLDETSYIHYFDEDGNVQILQKLETTMDRQWVAYKDIPQDLIHAAVAIEDKRFYDHQGVDWITTVKACANMFFGSSSDFGGSTLTQQLIKNLKLTQDLTADDVTVQRKVLEIFRAMQFEKVYDKEVVLEWYMNTVYFGNACYGVKSAAEFYFGKELPDMTTAELAALIGITNNPSMFNPYGTREYKYEGAVRDGAGRNGYRCKVILTQMRDQGWLTEEAYLDAYYQELTYKRGVDAEDRWNTCVDVVDASGNTVQTGCGYYGPVRDLITEVTGENEDAVTTYYCPNCQQKMEIKSDASKAVYSWYVDTVLEDVAKDLALADGVEEWNREIRANYINRICRSGYRIYTPYDANVQAAVDKIYTDLTQIPETKGSQQLQSAIVIIDNRSGDIVAMAGAVGEKTVADAWNMATDAKRQVGSSIKPLTVYGPAFEAGVITPATVMEDMPLMYNDDNPYPLNDSRTYNYHRTIYQAITQSLNAVSLQTLDKMGIRYSFNFAKNNFGLSSLVETGNGFSDMALAPLGMGALTNGATVREVTNAYSTFTNNGVYREGRMYLAVLDSEGQVVMENKQDSRTILSQKAVDYVNYCLDSAVAEGTGTVADMYEELGMDVAGKTGTTGDNKDRYFAGYTGYYTAAVWCGFEIPEQIKLEGNTKNPAARLWKAVMLQIHEGKETIPLYDSSKMVEVRICLESGKLACDACEVDVRRKPLKLTRIVTALVYPEDAAKLEAEGYCDKHVLVDYCMHGDGVANEYCQLLAQYGAIEQKLEPKALVKMTQATMDAILAAKGKGMSTNYLRDYYIYLVNEDGTDRDYFGQTGKLNQGLHVPYKICTTHTLEDWEKFLAENPWADPNKPEEPAPTDPVEPTEPIVPTQPVESQPETPEPTEDNNNWWDGIFDLITGR